jgi:hypothetical protein
VADADLEGWGCLVALAVVVGVGYCGYEALKEQQTKGDLLLGRDCPFGTERAGRHPPDGTDEWCQEKDSQGSYRRHGPAQEWYPSGQLKASGSYVHGDKEGAWTICSASGNCGSDTFRAGQLVNETPSTSAQVGRPEPSATATASGGDSALPATARATPPEPNTMQVGARVRISPKALKRVGLAPIKNEWGTLTFLDGDKAHGDVLYVGKVYKFKTSEFCVGPDAE